MVNTRPSRSGRYQERRRKLTAEGLKQHREYQRNYARLAARPEKKCCKCGETFPNTEVFFATGDGGRLTQTCVVCTGGRPVQTAAPQLSAKARQGACPLCERPAKRMVDRRAPIQVLLCGECLLGVNWLERAWAFRSRFDEYVLWRKKSPRPREGAGG